MKNPTELFYQIMWYPRPTDEVLGFLKRWYDDDTHIRASSFQYDPALCNLFARNSDPSDLLKEYLKQIERYSRVRRSLPFVSQIYLANSITFNALQPHSDIDLLIIAKTNRLWVARYASWFLLLILWVSRIWNRSVKKFCLTFYLEEKHENIYDILLQPLDIYMIFWLAHLVPLYTVSLKDVNTIRKENKWLRGYLPNHPSSPVIRLGNDLVVGSNRLKNFIEWVLGGRLGDRCNTLIAIVRKPFLYYKKTRLGKKWWWIIISDTMLKFHGDKRKSIMLDYLNATKSKSA